MPSNLVKSYAKKSGKSVADVEAAWKKAKRAVSKSYDPETNPNAFYGTVNKILRRKLNLEEKRTAKRFDMRRMNESEGNREELFHIANSNEAVGFDSEYTDVFLKFFQYAINAYEESDKKNLEDDIMEAVASAQEDLIYYHDMWKILENNADQSEVFSNDNPSWIGAIDEFTNDLYKCLRTYIEENDAENEEPEDEEPEDEE